MELACIAKSHLTSVALKAKMLHVESTISAVLSDCMAVPATFDSSRVSMWTIVFTNDVSYLLLSLFSQIWISLQSMSDSLILFVNQVLIILPLITLARFHTININFNTSPTESCVAHFADHMVAA